MWTILAVFLILSFISSIFLLCLVVANACLIRKTRQSLYYHSATVQHDRNPEIGKPVKFYTEKPYPVAGEESF